MKTPPRERRDWVTSTEISADTGLSFRMVDYWTREGVLVATPGTGVGQGNPRRYSLDQLARALALAELTRAGIDGQAVREHIDHLIQHGGYQVGAVTVLYTPDHT